MCNPTGQLISSAKGSLCSLLLGVSETSLSSAGEQKPFSCPPSSSDRLCARVSSFMNITLSVSRFTVSISESGVLQSKKGFIKNKKKVFYIPFKRHLCNKTNHNKKKLSVSGLPYFPENKLHLSIIFTWTKLHCRGGKNLSCIGVKVA